MLLSAFLFYSNHSCETASPFGAAHDLEPSHIIEAENATCLLLKPSFAGRTRTHDQTSSSEF